MALELKLSKDIEEEAQNCLATSDTSVAVKAAFYTWLLNSSVKHRHPENIIAFWNNVSAFLFHRKLSLVPLWEITSINLFESVYAKAMNDKLFRVANKKALTSFVQIGKLYIKFLKTKPAAHNMNDATANPLNQSDTNQTIKEAIIRVLKNQQCGMTVEQICHEIIANGLFSFGTQNPNNIVRIEISAHI